MQSSLKLTFYRDALNLMLYDFCRIVNQIVYFLVMEMFFLFIRDNVCGKVR